MQDVLNLLKKPVLSITGEDGLFIVFRKVHFSNCEREKERERERERLLICFVHSLGTMYTSLSARMRKIVKKF